MKVVMLVGILILAGGCGESPTEPTCEERVRASLLAQVPDGFWSGYEDVLAEIILQECTA